MMSNDDPRDGFFLSFPHTNYGFFFLLSTVFIHLLTYLFSLNTLLEMQFHMMTLLNTTKMSFAWVG